MSIDKKYHTGDIININSSEGDVKTVYVVSVNESERTLNCTIMCKKYHEVVPFENVINVVENNDSTTIRDMLSLGIQKFI